MVASLYKQFTFFRIAFYAFFVVLGIGIAPAHAQQIVRTNGPSYGGSAAPSQAAAQASPYTIENVVVDVTAKNAVMARQKALSEAQVKAYKMLAERFLPPEQMATFKAPNADAVSMLVQDYEVTNEQLSMRRYKGTFTIRFRPNAMRAQMASQGKIYSDAPQAAVLVLPFYQAGGSTVLWSDSNLWLGAWRAAPSADTFHPVTLPSGDAQDRAYLNDELGLNADPSAIADMAARYNAGDVAILVASPPQGAMGAQTLTVNLYALGADGPVFMQKAVVSARAGEPEQMLFARAVEDIKGRLRQNWKANAAYGSVPPRAQTTTETTVYQPQGGMTGGMAGGMAGGASPYPARAALGPSQTYGATVRFSSVQEWVKIKGALDRLYGMQSVMIRTLKPREAALDMRFAGDAAALQSALQNAGLSARAGTGGTLEIYSGSAIR